MAANTSLDFTSMDFDTLKASYLTFLRSQDIFKDYDFTGSDLNVLIDLLSVNASRHAFFTNMGLNEAFLDSAQLRTSVLSRAKELNYTPRSARSSKANITVQFQATGESQPYIIQKGQSFSTQIKNQNYVFSIAETMTVASANTTFQFQTDIHEGAYFKDSYVFQTNSPSPLRFKISNQNVDTSSIVINVFEDNTSIGDIYQPTISLLGLNNLSKVYFLQTNAADGLYEILFGDGVMGYQPKNGSLIVIDYRISNGIQSNGSSVFSINFDPTLPSSQNSELTGNIAITTNENALGGALIEDIETTRFMAPRFFEAQERACNEQDYEVLLKKQFPEIQAVNAFGGEKLTPPQFGKVVVAIDIVNIQGIPQSKKEQYYSFLKPRMMLSEFPIFIEPQFTYIDVNTIIRYNINVTTETDNRIKTLVLATIGDYNGRFLNKFNISFRASIFGTLLNQSDPSIVSNVTKLQLYKKVMPTNLNRSFVLNFGLQLLNDLTQLPANHLQTSEKTLSSSTFIFQTNQCILEDDNAGNVRIVQFSGDSFKFVRNIGTIDYLNGIVQLDEFTPDSFDGSSILVYVRPADPDIKSTQNTIISIEPANVKLKIEQVRE